jgi:CheY-like chemotaxis protein
MVEQQSAGSQRDSEAAPGNLVLIVDDRPDDSLLLERMLRRLGVSNNIVKLSSAEETIDYFSGQGQFRDRNEHLPPSVLFLDLKMPGKSGFHVLASLQNLPSRNRCTVFVVSELHSFSDINLAYRLGATSFFSKPLSESEIRECLRNRPDLWEFDAQKFSSAM